MRKIAILLDPDIGHINPVLTLADSLRTSNHYDVHLLGVADVEQFVGTRFKFHTIFEGDYPLGFLQAYKELQRTQSNSFLKENNIPRPHINAIVRGDLSETINEIDPDILIVLYSLSLEALLLKAIHPNLKCAIFTTWLRPAYLTPRYQAIDVMSKLSEQLRLELYNFFGSRDMESITNQLNQVPELIPCPREFDFPEKKMDNIVHYLGSLVRQVGPQSPSNEWPTIAEEKKLVFISFGSQTALFGKKALAVMEAVYGYFSSDSNKNYFLIMAVGDIPFNHPSLPSKITVVKWVPQVEILAKCALMITHGGLGTIKECIANEVPMVVIPMIYDQFQNAERVVYHGLGERIESDRVSSKTISDSVNDCISSAQVRENLSKMKMVFSKYDSVHFDVIESF